MSGVNIQGHGHRVIYGNNTFQYTGVECIFPYWSVYFILLMFSIRRLVSLQADLTLWRLLLPYGYSYKASCARPN